MTMLKTHQSIMQSLNDLLWYYPSVAAKVESHYDSRVLIRAERIDTIAFRPQVKLENLPKGMIDSLGSRGWGIYADSPYEYWQIEFERSVEDAGRVSGVQEITKSRKPMALRTSAEVRERINWCQKRYLPALVRPTHLSDLSIGSLLYDVYTDTCRDYLDEQDDKRREFLDAAVIEIAEWKYGAGSVVEDEQIGAYRDIVAWLNGDWNWIL